MAKEIKVCPSCGSSEVKFANFPDGGLHCSGCDSTFNITEKGKATPVDKKSIKIRKDQIVKDHERLGQVEKSVSELRETAANKPEPVVSDEDDFDDDEYMDDSGGFIEFD